MEVPGKNMGLASQIILHNIYNKKDQKDRHVKCMYETTGRVGTLQADTDF